MKSLVFVLILFITLLTTAQSADYHSPRTAALGGAGHAGPLLNDAIYLNPSFTSFLPSYSISANYQMFSGPKQQRDWGESDYYGRLYNFSIQDGRTELFQAGVGFTKREADTMIHLGASKTFTERFGVGAGCKFFFSNTDFTSLAQEATLSSTIIPLSWLQVVVVVDNMIESEQSISQKLYREFILGTKFNVMGIVLLYFDPHWVPNLEDGQFGHEVGIEITLMKDLFLRMGNFRNSMVPFQGDRGFGYSVGAGWISPRFSLDYSLTRVLRPTQGLPTATAHSLGMTLYF